MIPPQFRLRFASVAGRSVLGAGDVQLDRVGLDRELKSLRHNPDDCERAPIEIQDPADHLRVAIKMALPESIADQDLQSARPTARLFVRSRESAAEDRFHAEYIEEFTADLFSSHALRFLFVDQGERAFAIGRHVRKTSRLIAEIEKVGIRE